MLDRRTFVASGSCAAALPFTGSAALGNDLPAPLVHARDQLINYIYAFAETRSIKSNQKLVLNSLILPLDLSTDTPYFNHELPSAEKTVGVAPVEY